MDAYTGFAQVYDIFMDNVPYDEWTGYLIELLKENGVAEGLILELGCGTGNITRRLFDLGYDMIGIDYSDEMLEIAREYEYDRNIDCEDQSTILYLQQDMRSFELYGTVAAVVSICDSMNYITTEDDLLTVFQLVNNYLDPDGLFIFDMNTEYKYKHLLADNTIAENREDCSFIWENYYDEEKKLNEYNVTIFVKLEEEYTDDELDDVQDQNAEEELDDSISKDGYHEFDSDETEDRDLFKRFRETHYQKAYSIDTVKGLLEKAGLEFLAVYDAFTHNPPTQTSERVYFIAKEKYQENKTYI